MTKKQTQNNIKKNTKHNKTDTKHNINIIIMIIIIIIIIIITNIQIIQRLGPRTIIIRKQRICKTIISRCDIMIIISRR